MDVHSRKLARGLGRLLAVLLAICGIGLALLIPAMIIAFVSPDMLAGDYTTRVNGQPFDPSQPLVAGTLLLMGIVFIAVAAFVLFKLRQVMATVAQGDPFVPVNAKRLRAIAGGLGALLVAQSLGGLLVPPAVQIAARSEFHFNFGLFLATLVVLVLAEVFREGARLRADAEGTI